MIEAAANDRYLNHQYYFALKTAISSHIDMDWYEDPDKDRLIAGVPIGLGEFERLRDLSVQVLTRIENQYATIMASKPHLEASKSILEEVIRCHTFLASQKNLSKELKLSAGRKALDNFMMEERISEAEVFQQYCNDILMVFYHLKGMLKEKQANLQIFLKKVEFG